MCIHLALTDLTASINVVIEPTIRRSACSWVLNRTRVLWTERVPMIQKAEMHDVTPVLSHRREKKDRF